jgi:hypothetical protein
MLSPRIRQFLRLQRLAMALAGLTFGLLTSVFSNWLSEQGLGVLPWIIGVAVVSGLATIIFFARRPVGIEVAIESPRTIRSPEEARRYARRGFIGFVPLYRPQAGTAAAHLSAQARAAAVEARNFELLQVEESNLRPTIEAILSHASRLEYCWLLATRGQNQAGSAPYVALLAAYLHECKGLKCKFIYGEAYTISLDDDALVLSKTYDQVQQIFAQAERLGLAPVEMIADITSGFRSMALGMILACLNGDQDVEFVGTRYDDQGQPAGELFPIIFSFEPTLE